VVSALYWVPTELLRGVGIENPFTWALSYRIVSALIGWASVVGLALCVPRWIRDVRWQKVAVIVLALTWYLPALHARHSSENLSGSLFVIGLAILVLRSSWAWLGLAGLLWGFSFEARYQVAFMIAGGFLWFAFYEKRVRELGILILGIVAAIGIGTYLDSIGYGHWTFAPWNYFQFNLIEGHVISSDTSPVWDYFRRAWTETWPLMGFLSFAGLLLFWVRYPKHVLTWSTFPLFAFHTLIAHKETRFLFPMMHAAPVCWVLLVMSWQWLARLRWPLEILNGIALCTLTLIPASLPMRFYERAYPLSELYYLDQDPYTILGIPMYFYRPEGLKLHPLKGAEPPANEFWFAYPSANLPGDLAWAARCEGVFSTVPHWARELDSHHWMRNMNDWTLYSCR
jgi:phosphatidylinositol glycan class B